VSSHKRTAVFIGSTNERQFLRDLTGDRRFWPVAVGRVDIDKARSIIDQCFAEALHRVRAGERHWPERDEEMDVFESARQKHEAKTDWQEVLARDLDDLAELVEGSAVEPASIALRMKALGERADWRTWLSGRGWVYKGRRLKGSPSTVTKLKTWASHDGSTFTGLWRWSEQSKAWEKPLPAGAPEDIADNVFRMKPRGAAE
jgi:hypothetical protein